MSEAHSTVLDRFVAKTRKGKNGCIEWQASLDHGYGQFFVNTDGRPLRAQRVAYELFIGPIPEGLFVCHHCDNRRCVNPCHLFVGTHADNMNDMKGKGRQCRGATHGRRKMTEEMVLEIRKRCANGQSQRSIAMEFGIVQANVSLIVSRKIWRHLP